MQSLGVFAKYWQPGQVKTRLATSVGESAAAELYRIFVHTTLRRFQNIGDERCLCYWPASRSGAFSAAAAGAWKLAVQNGDGLGERIQNYFVKTLGSAGVTVSGETHAVLIGTDSPNLPRAYVERAFEALEESSAVLGPTPDGGYYLIGLRGAVPPIFHDIAWSTNEVYQQTATSLKSAGMTVAELDEWYDIDEAADLKRLENELASQSQGDPELAKLRADLETTLGKGS